MEVEKRMVDLREFHVPVAPVTFTGVLVAKMWDKKRPCIVCYFDDYNSNEHYILRAWWRPVGDDRGSYRIPGYDGDISILPLGSRMYCECEKTKTGKIGWKMALLLKDKVKVQYSCRCE